MVRASSVRVAVLRCGLAALALLAAACGSDGRAAPVAGPLVPAPTTVTSTPPTSGPAAIPPAPVPAIGPAPVAAPKPRPVAKPNPAVTPPRPAVVRTARAATAPRPPVVTGRVNLGGDHHPMVPQEPFGTIEIPKIGLSHPIFEGIGLPQIHWGPGHLPGSAMPGAVGNAFFAGHRVTHTRPFLDIDQLVPGDQIIFTVGTGRFVYEVTGHEIVTPDQVRVARPTPTPTVTLSACNPKGSARQRYVVYAKLIG